LIFSFAPLTQSETQLIDLSLEIGSRLLQPRS
jgi:hypothetical protein